MKNEKNPKRANVTTGRAIKSVLSILTSPRNGMVVVGTNSLEALGSTRVRLAKSGSSRLAGTEGGVLSMDGGGMGSTAGFGFGGSLSSAAVDSSSKAMFNVNKDCCLDNSGTVMAVCLDINAVKAVDPGSSTARSRHWRKENIVQERGVWLIVIGLLVHYCRLSNCAGWN